MDILEKWFYSFQPLVTFVKVLNAPLSQNIKDLCHFVMLQKYSEFLSRIIDNHVKACYGRLS